MEASSTSSSSSSNQRVVLSVCAAGAAATAAGCLWLKRSYNQQQQRAVAATDFDALLVTPVAPAAASSTNKAAQQHSATSFESFLKVQPAAADEPCSTDFASFLKDAALAGGGGGGGSAQGPPPAAAAAAKETEVVVIPESAVPVLVLFGTEYGFAREIAEKLSQALKDSGSFWPLLENAAHHPAGIDLAAQQAALLVFSTQGDGVPPTEAREFCDWLTAGGAAAAAAAPSSSRQRPAGQPLSYSVCALGDTSYTHFCRCGKSLDAALAAAGGLALTPRVDVDKEDWPAVDAWIDSCVAQLLAAVAAGSLRSFAELGGVAAVTGGSSAGSTAAGAAAGYSKSRPYYARVVSVEGLCVLSGPDDKDTVRLELQLEPEAVAGGGLSYTPGDALGIWPANPPQVVEELLQQLGASGDEAVTPPSWHYQEQQQQPPADSMTLRHALTVCYDIKTPKAKPLLQLLLAAAGDDDSSKQPDQQGAAAAAVRASIDLQVDATAAGRLTAAASPATAADKTAADAKAAASLTPAGSIAALQALLLSASTDAAALDAYLAPRHVADILQQFACARISHQQLLGVLRPLQPRLYSISSTPLEYSPAGSGVAATIAVVRYTSLGKERQGVASTQVAERLEPGTLLPVFISKNPDFRLPQNPATPIIMVGPGTGLAPFRSFILQRLLQQQEQGQSSSAAVGAMHLFFGCRRRDQDFLYGQQLQAWHDAGAITLHTAFSREGPAKVYVQQRLREAGAEVARLLQAGAHFYVCGDAGSMAGAVEEALLDIIAQHNLVTAGDSGDAASAAAQAYLQQLSDSGRYERDVWFS